MATSNGIGGVTNAQMIRKAKIKTYVSPISGLTTSVSSGGTHFTQFVHPQSDIAIVAIDLVYTSTSSDVVTDLTFGTVADPDAFATAQSSKNGAAVGDVWSVTLNSTSRKTQPSPNTHANFPILPAGTPLVTTSTGVSNSGSVKYVISYFPLDD